MQTSPLTCRRRGVVDCAEKRMRETDALGIHLDYPRGRSSVEVLVDELRAVCDRADRESRVGDVTLLDVQHACSGGKREVAVPDGELFERSASTRFEARPGTTKWD